MKRKMILVVDDELHILNLIERILTKEGYPVLKALNGHEALKILDQHPVDIVLTDIRMPEMDGITLLKKIKILDPSIKVLLMTAYASVDTAIEALKTGAQDYIRKPFDIEDVLESIRKTEMILTHDTSDDEDSVKADTILVCNSPAMKKLMHMIRKVAASSATVYIHGETGAGKELVARAIHENSKRKDKPFIKVNCSALPETLLESELFGYEKGAFTGAFAQKLGRFELANGGTIFLDEIGDISPLIQLKLLRVIQQKELERLGGTQTIALDVRVITATNKNLELLVEENKFREDLYYRLNVIPLTVPPLRERLEDLEELIQVFIKMNSYQVDETPKKLTDDAMNALLKYNWPGNVRELENIIERIIVISEDPEITLQDIPDKIIATSEKHTTHLSTQIDDAEEKLIRQALQETQGNITQAAQKLGISRRSLHRKINKFEIET